MRQVIFPVGVVQADKVWSDLASRLAIVEMDCEKAVFFFLHGHIDWNMSRC